MAMFVAKHDNLKHKNVKILNNLEKQLRLTLSRYSLEV
jgi:hypothetical protein